MSEEYRVQGKSQDLLWLEQIIGEAAWNAERVIRSAGQDLRTVKWESKGPADFVSDVDRDAEAVITDHLLKTFPDARVIGEELTPEEMRLDGLTFIVDPLDGTTNFLHGYPEYAVSIAALQDGELTAGIVLNVPAGDTYTAAKGYGTFRNGERIHVSEISDAARSLIGTGFPFKQIEQVEQYLAQFEAVMRGTAGVRRPGSAALDFAAVACGLFDGFWELDLAPWDIAAGLLLIREAGGVVTDLAGQDAKPVHGPFVAGNPAIHEWLLETLTAADQRHEKGGSVFRAAS